MSYLLMVLAVYFAVRTLDLYITAPRWIWDVSLVVLSCGSAVLWGTPSEWYVGFPVAGACRVLFHVDDLLITKADEARAAVMRRR